MIKCKCKHDEMELFLLSLAPQMRSLGKREQTRAKIEMLRILDDLDVQSQAHHGPGVPSYHTGPGVQLHICLEVCKISVGAPPVF